MTGNAERPIGSRAEELFTAALEMSSADRRSYLSQACGGDHKLRQRVESLVRAHEAARGFLPDTPETAPAEALELAGVFAVPATEKPGDCIGRYKLRQKLGEGGCGVVYLAEQQEPVRRKVALKVIKLGMDTRQVVARFEAERQALALMDHPNIAKVLDAGATETGRPYFVMELVGGIKITDYCELNHSDTRQRLDLFMQVCRAVQHAHQKGIIHRDLKPPNVLVADQDGVAVPKIIDFGIAKATQGRLTDRTVFTAFEQFLGTPAYMSPEQAELGGMDVDTRSDIYSLGVLLYELLTGKTPFDTEELLAAGLDAMRRTILEKYPPTPSTRLVQERLSAESAHAGKVRAYSSKAEIDKDLDWIVMKCLEKDRGRRYETANGLAMDIERHLNNEPVLARPPSRFYEFQRAVGRHKIGFAAIAAMMAVLAIGAAVSTWQAVRATQASKEALSQKRRADKEAATEQAINRFLNETLGSANPYGLSREDQAKGANITMLQVLDAAARRVNAGSFEDRPAIQAAICRTLGTTYLSLHQPEAAQPLLRKALALNRAANGEQSESVATSLSELAGVYREESRYHEQEKLLRQALELERKLHGNEHTHVAQALLQIADARSWIARGRYGAPELVNGVEETYREGLTLLRRLTSPDSSERIQPSVSFAQFLLDLRDGCEEADDLLRQALPVQLGVYGERNPATAHMFILLANASYRKRDFATAENLCERGIAIQREVLSTNHPALAASLNCFGDVLQENHKLEQAEAAFREALDIRRRTLKGNLDVAWSLRKLALNLAAQKRFPQAEVLFRETLAYWDNAEGEGPGRDAYWEHLELLTQVLKSQGKVEEIEVLYREVLNRVRNALDSTHVAVPAALCQLADFLFSRDQSAAAEELYHDAQSLIPRLGPGRNRVATWRLVESLCSRNQFADAEQVYARLIQSESQNPDEPNFVLGELHHAFGDLLDRQKRFAAASEEYFAALSIRCQKPNLELQYTLQRLGSALIECGKPGQAERYLREALSGEREGRHEWSNASWTRKRLADALLAQGKLPEAERAYREAVSSYQESNATNSEDFRATVERLRRLSGFDGGLAPN